MKSLGAHLDAEELHLLFLEMDVDEDGRISFDEFCDVMATNQQEEESDANVGNAIFNMIDHDGSGHIETSELKVLLRRFELGEEEIDNAVALFDFDHSGDISKKEFCETIERMRSFAV